MLAKTKTTQMQSDIVTKKQVLVLFNDSWGKEEM